MTKPAGTTNIFDQFVAYNKLREEYSPEVANALTQKNLERHGITVTPEGVEEWYQINSAAVNAKLDIPAERRTAEAQAADIIQNTVFSQSEDSTATPDASIDEEFVDEESENERPSLHEIYGYEDDESNEEAAFDDYLKIHE